MTWSNYLIVLLIAIGSLALWTLILVFAIRKYRRDKRTWLRFAVLFCVLLLSFPLFLVGAFGTRQIVIAPTPVQASQKVAAVLQIKPTDVGSIRLHPYSYGTTPRRPGPLTIPFPGKVISVRAPTEIDRICKALNSAHAAPPSAVAYPNHPNRDWKVYFEVHTKSATHDCEVTKTSKNVALIDLFYKMTDRERCYLGTYESKELASVLEAIARK